MVEQSEHTFGDVGTMTEPHPQLVDSYNLELSSEMFLPNAEPNGMFLPCSPNTAVSCN